MLEGKDAEKREKMVGLFVRLCRGRGE